MRGTPPRPAWTRFDPRWACARYPELAQFDLVPVDIVDDGETLSSLEDSQLDFIIANHMLEHTENPLGAIRNHLRKIRSSSAPEAPASEFRRGPATHSLALVRFTSLPG